MDKRRIARWAYGLSGVGFCIYLSVARQSIFLAGFAVAFITGVLFLAHQDKKFMEHQDREPSDQDPAGPPGTRSEADYPSD